MTIEGQSGLFERIRFRGDPVASPDSTVVSGHARFTILTPRLIRLEWSETGVFEDRSTYAFPTRDTSTPPQFSQRVGGDDLVVDTGPLRLRYTRSSGRFSADNLSISFDLGDEQRTWMPGMSNPANLRGTRRTLDECDGDAGLEEGILSRAGWAVFDDSRSVVFNPDDGWVAPRPDHDLQDWYFFGYGHDYKAALTEYTRFGGRIPLIPRFALGGWWSRFWVYSDQDLKELVHEFETYDVPLDVLVVDIDWHTPDSWTGYTWNRELFPDPPAFIEWVHDKGLRTSLNLHPAEGVQSFEEVYPRFAEAMGVDPAGGQAIPFRIADKRYVQNYFELIHHPMEDDGIDFWWIDWQQGESTEIKGLDPLPWLNHLHFCDLTRHRERSLLFSRWGGLGNHRYQIGFSGDTYAEWAALQFQPYFTAAAANVLYGWWSHDIGGHMGGATEPELYARWVQFGALSPCLRLHATKDPLAERRPWKYPPAVYQAALAAFHWRYRLVPYIYTMARVAYDTGISLCRPMYYEYPGQDAAYVARYQYFFGDQMIAAPIVHPADPETGMAPVTIWFPEGIWIDYTTKETFTGPCWVRLVGDLDRVPMLVKAGAILPLALSFQAMSPPHLASGTTDGIPRDRLVLSVFPGGDGVFHLYEDDGTTETYTEDQVEWTEIRTHIWGEDTWVVHIAPVEGYCKTLPAQRQVEVRLEGSRRPRQVTVNGAEVIGWTYDPAGLSTIINVPLQDKRQPVEIIAIAEGAISALGEPHNRAVILSDVQRLLGDAWSAPVDDADTEGLFRAVFDANSPGRSEAIARLGGPFVHFFEYVTPEEAGQQLGRVVVSAPNQGERSYDLEATFTRFREGKREQHTVQMAGAKESHILDVPWAFDGQVRAGRWEADLRITWRGETLVYSHRSKPLFPTIYTWRSLVYDEHKEPVLLKQVMDEAGWIKEGLDWQPCVQNLEQLRNINQPHAVLFFKEYRQELQAGSPLAAFLATTVISPDERDVIVRCKTSGLAELYLNGQRIEEALAARENEGLPSFTYPIRETEVVRLRAGINSLVVDAKPAQSEGLRWFFGGAFATPDGEKMLDLSFE